MSTPGNIIMWGICGVCTLALTVAKTSSIQRISISKKNTRIVKYTHFDTGFVKIIDGDENELRLTEVLQSKRLKQDASV